MKYLTKKKIAFTISADITPEFRRVCTQPDLGWTLLEGRPRETVDFAEVELTPGNWPKDASPLRYVALRISPCQTSLFSYSPKYLAVVSNQWQISVKDLVRWHWEKAGTIRLTHDVTKNDLAVGFFPVGSLAPMLPGTGSICDLQSTNGAAPTCSARAFSECPAKRLRYEVFTIAAEISSHARQLTARLGVPPLTADELIAVRGRLRELQATIRGPRYGFRALARFYSPRGSRF